MTDAPEIVPLPYTIATVASTLGEEGVQTLLSAYRWMELARALDARMTAFQRQGRVGFYGAATGQEAVNVAAGLLAAPEDWVFPGLREQLVALVRGHSLVVYLNHLFANHDDPARGRQMPCHPTAREANHVSMSSVIGTQISQAVGAAYAMKRRASPGVAWAFFGDGATSSNDFHAGLNMAGTWQVPVVFCCTNNQWAISIPVERQTHVATLAQKARAYGLPGERVDGTDLVAVLASLRSALARARTGGGPSMIEFLLFRMTPHSSSDDPSRYQAADWIAKAQAHDPVRRLRGWLERQDLLTPAAERAIAEEADAQVRAAVGLTEGIPAPDPSSLWEDVFAAPLLQPRGT